MTGKMLEGKSWSSWGAGLLSLCHHVASRFLYVLSLRELLWASSQHGSFSKVGLFTWQLRVMVWALLGTRSCLAFLTHRASHPLHLFDCKQLNPLQSQEEETWPHLPVGQMSRSHCKKNTWNGRYCCSQFGKYNLIGLEHPSSIFYFRVFLTILTRRSLSSNLFRNRILEVNSLIIMC